MLALRCAFVSRRQSGAVQLPGIGWRARMPRLGSLHSNDRRKNAGAPLPREQRPPFGGHTRSIARTGRGASEVQVHEYLRDRHRGVAVRPVVGPIRVAEPPFGQVCALVMGHEISGVIDSVGQGVDGWSAGERVVVNNVRTCGTCFWCTRSQQAVCPNMAVAGLSADGGLAEYMTWPANMIVRLPDSIPDVAAPLTEPAMVGVHAARRSGVKPGDTVCVLGCGTVGLMTVQAFAAAGARVIAVDVRQQSLKMARDLSADVTIDAGANDVAATLLELTDGIGPDIVVETAGAADTPVQAINWCRRAEQLSLLASTRPLRGWISTISWAWRRL